MSAPLVSVVIPVYQREFCIREAVASVLVQTHAAIECIVVDDGSTDGSAQAVDRAFGNDSRVRVFARDHAGVSAARNAGLRHAQGLFVTFLDSDDLMPPERVARQLNMLGGRTDSAIVGRSETIAAPGVAIPHWLGAGDDHYWMSVLVATELVRTIGGFDEIMTTGEDLDLLVRLRASGVQIEGVDDVFTVHRFFGDNLTLRIDNPAPALHDAVRRHLARRRGTEPGRGR